MGSEEKSLQQLLKQLRKKAELSQHNLANALQKPQSFVSKYESGERRLDILELRQICIHLNIELLDFVELLEKALTSDNATQS